MDLKELVRSRAADLDDVGAALSQMWRGADAAVGEDGEAAIVKACGLTLIAIASSDAEFAATSAAVAAATSAVPARTLLVQIDADVPKGLSADVAGICSLGPAGRPICQEQVIVKAAKSRVGDLPSLIAPLPVSDLPAVLLIQDVALVRSDLVRRLLPVIDVVIVDTRHCDDVAETFAALLAFEDAHRLVVRDLAFERLTVWREAIASAYDEVKGEGAQVTAVSATCPGEAAEGWLLLGWVESRFPQHGRPFVRMKRPAGSKSHAGGAVCAIELEVQDSDKRSDIRIEQQGNCVLPVTARGDEPVPGLPRPLADELELLTGVLLDPSRDRAYDSTLRAVIARNRAR